MRQARRIENPLSRTKNIRPTYGLETMVKQTNQADL